MADGLGKKWLNGKHTTELSPCDGLQCIIQLDLKECVGERGAGIGHRSVVALLP